MAEVSIQTERVDDIPLLIGQQEKMGIPEVVDAVIRPHGHRQGLSVGWVVAVWLSYILSEADHRMVAVEEWACKRLETLGSLLPGQVTAGDFTDDRLGDILRYLSDDPTWAEIEQQLGQHLLRVYQLPAGAVRLDSTSVAVYHDSEETTFFRHGHSKDHRPDLAQFKVMLGALDPMGMPLATLVVPGDVADDGLYVPVIDEARIVLQQAGHLYVGDNKMEALQTRAYLVQGGDYYLVPLSQKGAHPQLLASLVQPVWAGSQSLVDVTLARKPDSAGDEQEAEKLLAQGYETSRQQEAQLGDDWVTWQERILVVYSPALAEQASKGLAGRLERAEKKLQALTPPKGRGKRKWTELGPLQEAAEAILNSHRVREFLQVDFQEEVTERTVRRYRDRPTCSRRNVRYRLQVRRNQEAIVAAQGSMGWRLYVTNAPEQQLPLAQAVLVYRSAPRIERNFLRLKGRPLGLRPLYVQREDHARGMVRLLSLALRILTLTEFVVRQQLQHHNETLPGLYPGNPKRTTDRPTTERLLTAFSDITLTVVRMPGQAIQHLTPLSELQQRILSLLDLPATLYQELAMPIKPNPP